MRLSTLIFLPLFGLAVYTSHVLAEDIQSPVNEGQIEVEPEAISGDASSEGALKLADESLSIAENVNLKEVVAKEEGSIEGSDLDSGSVNSESAAPQEEGSDEVVGELASGTERNEAVEERTGPASGEPEIEKQGSLRLLSSEVLPGTSARLAWEPSVSFMGISAPTAVLVVNGTRKGPTLCLTSAVHGDELNGIEIVRHILYNIEASTLAGAVIGVPIVNLQGFRRSSRYLPDRRDLNRYFPGNPNGSAASRIASSFFSEVVHHCDMLVDLHTGSFKRTNLPQLRADLAYKRVADLAARMGSIVVVQSRGHSGSLRRAAVESGVPAVTLEAGEPHILDKDAVGQGIKSIQSLLHASNMAKTLSFWELRRGPVYYKSRWVRTVNGGILFSSIELGDVVGQGDVLGTVTDPITNLSTDIVSPHNGKIIGMALDQVLYPGYAAYHIGLQAPASEAAEDEIQDVAEANSKTNKNSGEESAGQAVDYPAATDDGPENESESVMEIQILEDSE